MQTLEQQINQLLNAELSQQWSFYGLTSLAKRQSVERWTWTTEDEIRARSSSKPLIYTLIDELILEAPLAEALTSSSEYIRERRLVSIQNNNLENINANS